MSYPLHFTHCFDYKDFRGRYKPIISVCLECNGYEYSLPMLVDSGADTILLPIEAAAAFELEVDKLPEVPNSGANGDSHAYRLDNVKIIIVDNEIEITAPVYFLEGYTKPFGLLGREVIFESLMVAFKENRVKNIYMCVEQ